jgi:hypothetical protein
MYTNADYTKMVLICGEARRIVKRGLLAVSTTLPKQSSTSSHYVSNNGEALA